MFPSEIDVIENYFGFSIEKLHLDSEQGKVPIHHQIELYERMKEHQISILDHKNQFKTQLGKSPAVILQSLMKAYGFSKGGHGNYHDEFDDFYKKYLLFYRHLVIETAIDPWAELNRMGSFYKLSPGISNQILDFYLKFLIQLKPFIKKGLVFLAPQEQFGYTNPVGGYLIMNHSQNLINSPLYAQLQDNIYLSGYETHDHIRKEYLGMLIDDSTRANEYEGTMLVFNQQTVDLMRKMADALCDQVSSQTNWELRKAHLISTIPLPNLHLLPNCEMADALVDSAWEQFHVITDKTMMLVDIQSDRYSTPVDKAYEISFRSEIEEAANRLSKDINEHTIAGGLRRQLWDFAIYGTASIITAPSLKTMTTLFGFPLARTLLGALFKTRPQKTNTLLYNLYSCISPTEKHEHCTGG